MFLRLLFSISFVVLIFGGLFAQAEPVTWTFDAQKINDSEYEIVATAEIQEGWSVYSKEMEADMGPIPTHVSIDNDKQLEVVGEVKEEGKKEKEFNKIYGIELVKFTGRTSFKQRVKVQAGLDEVKGQVTFMSCTKDSCLPPQDLAFVVPLNP